MSEAIQRYIVTINTKPMGLSRIHLEKYPHGNLVRWTDCRRKIEALVQQNKELIEAAKEARLQIIYLHGKFQETGSGNEVVAKLEDVLAKCGEGI